MKVTSFYLTKATRIIFTVLTVSVLAVTLAMPEANAQQPRQLSLADIIIGLKSAKATLPERNRILSEAVVERGITFALTPEIEKELAQTGAAKELVDAIRLKSPIIKTSAVVEPPQPKPQPKPVAVESLPDFSFYQKRADDNMGKAEYDLAIVDYNKALELNPKSVPAYFNRARAFYFKRDFASAVASYGKAIELTPKDSVAFYNRGVSYEKMGDAVKAADDYQKAVELDENNTPAKENLKKIRDAEVAQKQPVPPAPKQMETAVVNQPPPTDSAVPPVLNYGRIDASQAVKMVMPAYPVFARNMSAEGQVVVDVEIDEQGSVTSAKAVSGHALLRNPAEDAARKSKFKPATVGGKTVKATGQIFYNFKR